MELNHPSSSGTRAGTWGGTAVVLWMQIGSAELLKTAVLAAIGAAVSFLVSLLLKWIVRSLRSAKLRRRQAPRGS
jgi:hypothetical protein